MFKIDIDITLTKLQEYLHLNNWFQSGNERILSIEKPGEGNMNVVLRVKTNERSFILKQSRPYVQKYKQIDAPLNRIHVEQEFYRNIKEGEINRYFPKMLNYNSSEYILMLEDLGPCEDMTSIYQKRKIKNSKLEELVTILKSIHENKELNDFPDNMEMRLLNHQHIFVLPFLEDNGFHLDEIQKGLEALSKHYKTDSNLKRIIDNTGKLYLKKGNVLLHGDYYPGSWMNAGNDLYIIDPEFSFIGFVEFDLGVLIAHLIIVTLNDSYLETVLQKYDGTVDSTLTAKIAGIEIMRRLIGLAQLPLDHSIREKEHLLKIAHKMIMI